MTEAAMARPASVTGKGIAASGDGTARVPQGSVTGKGIAASGDGTARVPQGSVTGKKALHREEFKAALARHASGVVVVTAAPDGGPAGLTATSFTSVSLEPPLVSFYVAQSSTTLPQLRAAPTFAVNVLGHDQSDLAARFATRDVDRFAAPTRWRPGPGGEPLLADAAVHLLCAWYATHAVGDHWLVVGQVNGVEHGALDAAPLLYHRGRFGRFQPHPHR